MNDSLSSVMRFTPHYMERVWGGVRLSTQLRRQMPVGSKPIGESWELTDSPEAQSIVISPKPWQGLSLNELWMQHRDIIFGITYREHTSTVFPLLMKIIDSAQDLSIQVHPDDASAAAGYGEAKSEAWCIVDADPQAKLYVDLLPHVSAAQFAQALEDGTVHKCVTELDAIVGGCIAIPGGTVHAIGAGLLIYEIQQNSDTTYRVYDWGRVGLDGKPRQLHQSQALAVTRFGATRSYWLSEDTNGLLTWPHFQLWKSYYRSNSSQIIAMDGRFKVGAIVEGEIEIDGVSLVRGDFFLVPAYVKQLNLIAQLETQLLWVGL